MKIWNRLKTPNVFGEMQIKKYCMSHLGWVWAFKNICPKCGSAMLENKDLT